MTDSVWRELSIPSGVSVWRDGSGQIVAAVHVSSSGFTWCQPAGPGLPPQSPEEVALRSGREFFPLADDEKTEVAAAPNGLLERLVATAGAPQVETFTWPEMADVLVDAPQPLRLDDRARLTDADDWCAPGRLPRNENARVARYRRLQSWYRQHVLNARPGTFMSHKELGSYLHVDEVADRPALNFIHPDAYRHAVERNEALNVIHSEPGTLSMTRVTHNMLSSMPLCFNLFGTMRGQADFLVLFQALFDQDATGIEDITCEWAPSPTTDFLNDSTGFDAIVQYWAGDRRRFVAIETKYTEPFSAQDYDTPRYREVTQSPDGWFTADESTADILKSPKSNQLWRNTMLASLVEQKHDYDRGSVAVVALRDDSGAKTAIELLTPHLVDPSRVRPIPIEDIIDAAGQLASLSEWATEFSRRYLDVR